jgi:citronellol/citronellal dehydrogenase
MGRLDGKVAIITGASRGLGKDYAIGFAREGAKVALAARTVEPLASGMPGTIMQVAEKAKEAGGEALPIKTNVMVEEEVEAMVKQVLDKWGTIDILINNAGVGGPAPVWEMPLKRWNIVIQVNLNGTMLCTKHVLPTMMKNKKGSIINISTYTEEGHRLEGGFTGPGYRVAKRAIEQLTYTTAAEVGKYGIAVNCLKPLIGVKTEGLVFMSQGSPTGDAANWIGGEEMVKAALFLALQNSKGCTAQVAYDAEYIAWHGLQDWEVKPLPSLK